MIDTVTLSGWSLIVVLDLALLGLLYVIRVVVLAIISLITYFKSM